MACALLLPLIPHPLFIIAQAVPGVGVAGEELGTLPVGQRPAGHSVLDSFIFERFPRLLHLLFMLFCHRSFVAPVLDDFVACSFGGLDINPEGVPGHAGRPVFEPVAATPGRLGLWRWCWRGFVSF